MRHRAALILISVLLFAAGFFNYRPWRGCNSGQRVALISEPIRIADNLLHQGTFANPFFAMPTGPTAHIAPGLPFVQFLILRTWGEGADGWLAIQVLPVLALSLELALLPWIAGWLGFSARTGVVAAIFALITKPGSEPQWEAHLAGLLALVLLGAACRCQDRTSGAGAAFATGFVAGLVFYFQPVFALPYFVWVAIKIRTRYVLALAVVPVALCLPWILRNYREIGSPVMRDNLGLELYVSYNDCAAFGFQENLKSFCNPALHPHTNIQEASELHRLGESEYNRERGRRALAWISSHGGAAATLIAKRTWFFWFPSTEGWSGYARQRPRYFFLHVLTLASFLGLGLCWKHRLPCARLFGLWLALFPLVYYVVQFEPRYRYPILSITWLLAAYAAEVAVGRAGRIVFPNIKRDNHGKTSRSRQFAGEIACATTQNQLLRGVVGQVFRGC